jgi:hypothetical protein
MHQDVQRHRDLIDASGLGLLPGVALAFALAVLATGALVLESWVMTLFVLLVVLGGAACVACVVFVLSDDED